MKGRPVTVDHKKILKLWKKTRVVHPGYGAIAKEVGCSKGTVRKVVVRYLENGE